MNETCDAIENCGPDPISFASKEAICEEGSLTVLLALFFIGISFAIVQVIHHLRPDKHEVVGLYDRWNVIERIFVKPFVPTSIEAFVVGIFFVWFWLTVPIGLSRYYDKDWKQLQIATHGPLNLMSWAVGCKGFDMKILTYTPSLDDLPHPFEKQNVFKKVTKIFRRKRKVIVDPAREHYKEVDWIFTIHLIFGVIWLTSGFLQIFLIRAGWSTSRELRVLSHRWFGRIVAMPSVIIHLSVATITFWKNPVNQHPLIEMVYLFTLFGCFRNLGLGFKYAHEANLLGKHLTKNPPEERTEEDKEKEDKIQYLRKRHKTRMGILYIESIQGSGAIRVAVWIQWIVGKFFSRTTRYRISRGFCQEFSYQLGLTKRGFMGDSDECLEPIIINLLLLNLINDWLKWLYLCMLKRDGQLVKRDENQMKIAARVLKMTLLGLLVIVLLESLQVFNTKKLIVFYTKKLIKFAIAFYAFSARNELLHYWIDQQILKGRKKKVAMQARSIVHSVAEFFFGNDEDDDHNHEKED